MMLDKGEGCGPSLFGSVLGATQVLAQTPFDLSL